MTQSPDLDRRGGTPLRMSGGDQSGLAGIAVRQAWFIPVIAAAVAVILLVLFWDRPITDDVAWYLMGTRDWLNGAVLYEMVVEVNPPLNFYFTVPAILIADFFGVSDTNGQYILTALMLFGSLLWCGTIIRDAFGLSPARQAMLLTGIGAAMVIPALDSIGQREQSLVILMMPWLLGQVAGTPPNARVDVPRAVVAALGVCLKPHFVLYPIAVTLVWIVRTQSLKPIVSPANLVFLAVGLAYVAYVAAVHPAYLFDIVPMASQVYGAYKTDAGMLATASYPRVLLLLLPFVFALRDREVWMVPGIFGAAVTAGLVSYAVQGTAFPYHLIPVSVFGMVACAVALVRARRFAPVYVAVAIAFVGLAALGLRQGYPKHSAVDHLAAVADEVGAFDSFISLSGSLFAGPPIAMATGAEWVSRYPANWLVPGAIGKLEHEDCARAPERCASLRAIAARNRSDNIADMARAEPDLLIVDLNSRFFPEPGFDWLAFMAEDPDWAGVFAEYREVARTTQFSFYRREKEKTPP